MKREKRILISGYEIGGQMQLLVETIRKRWISATSVAYNNDYRGYQNDINLSDKTNGSLLKRTLFFIWALMHYDVFHFFWGVSMLSIWKFHLLDLPILKFFNKKIIVHFRGLDVVDIKYFDYLRSKARGEEIQLPDMSRADQLKKLIKWNKYADTILVSEPDLYFVSEKSVLSPQVIDLSYWRCNLKCKSEEDGIVRIVHAPSSRRKKGTDFIEKTVEKLKNNGFNVQLILAENLPHHKIKELYEISDIGLDQVLYGWHGKVSVELMALGKPVICNINPELRKYRPDLPIIHGDPQNLYGVLKELILDKSLREKIGKESAEYASKYHDVEMEVDELLKIYGINNTTFKLEKLENVKSW
jgi:glycosyltransferase involved in cell wall biosynthesis